MEKTTPSKERNQAIEWCRLIASVFVVFVHCAFPGKLGEITEGLARFAVPFFFAISGYFCYGATTRMVKRRILGVVKLECVATLWYVLWGSYKGKIY